MSKKVCQAKKYLPEKSGHNYCVVMGFKAGKTGQVQKIKDVLPGKKVNVFRIAYASKKIEPSFGQVAKIACFKNQDTVIFEFCVNSFENSKGL